MSRSPWLCALLLLGMLTGSCDKLSKPKSESESTAAGASQAEISLLEQAAAEAKKLNLPKRSITLYYKHRQFDALYAIPCEIEDHPSPENRLFQMIDQLSLQPKDKKAVLLWPRNTSVRMAYLVKPDTIVIDFYSRFLENLSVGAGTEELMIYSLVNSVLLNNPGYKNVQILVEGQVVETLLGHVDVESLLQRENLYTVIPEYADEDRIQVEELSEPPATLGTPAQKPLAAQ